MNLNKLITGLATCKYIFIDSRIDRQVDEKGQGIYVALGNTVIGFLFCNKNPEIDNLRVSYSRCVHLEGKSLLYYQGMKSSCRFTFIGKTDWMAPKK